VALRSPGKPVKREDARTVAKGLGADCYRKYHRCISSSAMGPDNASSRCNTPGSSGENVTQIDDSPLNGFRPDFTPPNDTNAVGAQRQPHANQWLESSTAAHPAQCALEVESHIPENASCNAGSATRIAPTIRRTPRQATSHRQETRKPGAAGKDELACSTRYIDRIVLPG